MAIEAKMYLENLQGLSYENIGFDGSIYDPQQKNQQQLHQHKLKPQMQQVQGISYMKNISIGDCGQFHLPSVIEKNNQEIIQFYNLQNEKLMLMLKEQRKQEFALLVQKIEPKVQEALKQKDDEIAKATLKKMELESFIRKLEIENQAWQRVARDNEAVIMSLNNTIEQVKESNAYAYNFNNAVEEVESCCDNAEANEENIETNIDIGEQRRLCPTCNSLYSSVLFLPCRHICSCQSCEPFLDTCPVCQMNKTCSIVALFS